MNDILKIKLNQLNSIIPLRLIKVLEECGVETVQDLSGLDIDAFRKHRAVDQNLENYLEQIKNKINQKPHEILLEMNLNVNHSATLSEEDEEDLKFMKSFTEVLNKYDSILAVGDTPSPSTIMDWKTLQGKQESIYIEFKSTLRWDLKESKVNKELEEVCAKTIAAFLNRNGGRLIIGMDDNGKVLGLKEDFDSFSNKRGDEPDWFVRQLSTIIERHLGGWVLGLVRIKLISVGDNQICIVRVQPANEPCFIKMLDGSEKFYIRSSTSSKPLQKPSDINKYIEQRWK